jgi:hypothetical protein
MHVSRLPSQKTVAGFHGSYRSTLYFFFPLPFFVAGVEPLDMTLPARDVLADAALLPFPLLPPFATLSSFLFYKSSQHGDSDTV